MGELGGSRPGGGCIGALARRAGSWLGVLWPLSWVVLAGLLGSQALRSPTTLAALRPWGPEFRGLPLAPCSNAEQAADCERLEPGQQARFVEQVQLALLALAERLNALRQVGSAALLRGGAEELGPAGQRAIDALERELLRSAEGRPLFLSGRDFLLRDPAGRFWRLDLSGFDACLSRLPELDCGSRASLEGLLGDLDRAYYRVVAIYRALSELQIPAAWTA